MSSTSQPTDFSDLYTDLMNRTREDTSVAATVTQAKRYINIALYDMHLGQGEQFRWAERRAQLLTRQRYTTGTLFIAKGSTSVVGAATAWDAPDDFSELPLQSGDKVIVSGTNEVYQINNVVGANVADFTSKFVGDDVSGASYVSFTDEYALASDFLRPIDQQSFDDNRSIDLVGRTEFRRRYPRNSVPGTIKSATLIDLGPSGSTARRQRIRFSPPPQNAELIPYTYVTSNLVTASDGTAQTNLSADADEPIVPLQYRHAIVYGALATWYRDKKDDARAGSAAADYARVMTRIMSDNEIGGARAQIRPRITTYARSARRPWRGGGGRYDTGGRFDRFEA